MVVGNKDKRARKKEKEERDFERLPSLFFPPFLFGSHIIVYFEKLFWSKFGHFLYFEGSNSFEFLKFRIIVLFGRGDEFEFVKFHAIEGPDAIWGLALGSPQT